MFVGVAGLEPTTADPNSAVLPITPYPNFKTSYRFHKFQRKKINYIYDRKILCKDSELFGILQTFRLLLYLFKLKIVHRIST